MSYRIDAGGGLRLVFLGLSLSSSWGNGHATTYRSLLSALSARGHEVLFLERDTPWYAANRDLAHPAFCGFHLYNDVAELASRYGGELAAADAVFVGSFVPEGVAVAGTVLSSATGIVGFYDIDTPVTLARLEAGETDYISAELIPEFDLYLSFTSGPTLDRLRRDYGARLPRAFHCMVDPGLYRPTGESAVWDLGYLGTYSADRQPALERLLLEPARRLPQRRFVVAGAQYPPDIDWPTNVAFLEHVPPAEHAGFYGRMRFALNLTRSDMREAGWSPSVRLFEAAACGTAILSDRWQGIDDFFPVGEALMVVDDADDVVAALDAADSRAVRSLAARAREIVLAEHTGARRAEELEQAIAAARLERRSLTRMRRPSYVLSA